MARTWRPGGDSAQAASDELFADQALFEAVPGVEQDAVTHIGLAADIDHRHIAHAAPVRVRHHGTFLRLHDLDPDEGGFWKDRSPPAARAKGGHSRQCENLGAD